MAKIGGGPKGPIPPVRDSEETEVSGEVADKSDLSRPGLDSTEDVSDRVSDKTAPPPLEDGTSRPSTTSLASGIAPRSRSVDGDSEVRELAAVKLGPSSAKGAAFEMAPSSGGGVPPINEDELRGLEISPVEPGIIEITEGETFGDPFDQRWEVIHPASLHGLTPRSDPALFKGPPLTGNPIRMRFRLKEPEPGRTFNVRVPGPELSLRDALNSQCKNAAKIMDRLGDSGLGRFEKVQLQADGQMNIQKPSFKEGEEFRETFGEAKAERLEFHPNQDAVLVRLDGSRDESHKDYFRDRAFDPRIRDTPSSGTPSENEAEALTKSIRKACAHGNLELTERPVSASGSVDASKMGSGDPVADVLALGESPPLVRRDYRGAAKRVRDLVAPESKEAAVLEKMVSFLEESEPGLETERERLANEQVALTTRLKSGAVDGDLELDCEEFLASRSKLDEDIEDLRLSAEDFETFLVRSFADLSKLDELGASRSLEVPDRVPSRSEVREPDEDTESVASSLDLSESDDLESRPSMTALPEDDELDEIEDFDDLESIGSSSALEDLEALRELEALEDKEDSDDR